jgi:ABC-type multidrug transport system fused ATPase/permease subunit
LENSALNETLQISSLVDLLNRTSPNTLLKLRNRYPEYSELLEPGRLLGEARSSHTERSFLTELLTEAVDIAKKESSELRNYFHKRLQTSRRLRIAGNLISSISTAGLIAAIIGSQKIAMILSAVVAFLASSLSLVAQYFEDFAGGQNALRELRERLSRLVLELSEAEGDFRIFQINGRAEDLIPLVRKVNAIVANIRQIQVHVIG